MFLSIHSMNYKQQRLQHSGEPLLLCYLPSREGGCSIQERSLFST